MLGGLYGDLPPPSDEEKQRANGGGGSSSVWSSSTTKMAPPTLRKPAFTPPQTVLKPKTLIHSSKTTATSAPNDVAVVLPSQQQLVGVTSSVADEYDPARPNDYEEYRRDRKKKMVEAEMRRELERRRQEEEEREREREREEKRDYPDERLSISGEEAWRRRAAMSGGAAPGYPPSPPTQGNADGDGGGGGGGFVIGKSETSGLGVGAGGQMTAAQRMMAKMGWKEGQGLGKQEQGITTPLVAKKTDRRAGVIVNASDNKSDKKVKGVSFNGPPTRILLLRNMVGPGEVDDELEDEVASECAKYGMVTRVLIFEITEPNFPTDEAVRIFIQFERSEETTKAYIDLDGRYFGGRVVHAAFYSEERFSNNELAPLPGEIPGYP
ncbi:G-patch domain-containing protein [Cephalotus follicularis]|uniref:G-patch domain-containing protein n=1 Tax=Cephalotus follicularis TaxID=3775 RepID=A0A1Q3BH05_CEPFO|nr:G-patch domain-containing protein [Cephalotus follicularis]